MWTLYDRLIKRITSQERITDVVQADAWMMVKTSSGRLGIAAPNPARSGKRIERERFIGMPVREAAKLIKSWDFEEAALGQAAINAVINNPMTLPVTENPDAFLRYKDICLGKKVAVIGHFAYLENRLEGLCDLYVLERKPGPKDYPDPACEYLLPEMDVVFITGCSIANKTMPRLLELSKHAFTIISGPSTPMDPLMLEMGADALCGFCVADEQICREAVEDRMNIFASGRMVCMEREDEHDGEKNG